MAVVSGFPPETAEQASGRTRPVDAAVADRLPLYSRWPEAYPPALFETPHLSRILSAPSGGHFLERCPQLLALTYSLPSLRNLASPNNSSLQSFPQSFPEQCNRHVCLSHKVKNRPNRP